MTAVGHDLRVLDKDSQKALFLFSSPLPGLHVQLPLQTKARFIFTGSCDLRVELLLPRMLLHGKVRQWAEMTDQRQPRTKDGDRGGVASSFRACGRRMGFEASGVANATIQRQ